MWTIGHSGHPSHRLVELLRDHAVDTVVDVRSAPYSRIHPQHTKGPLTAALREAGIAYRFAGRELGGRPGDEELYDGDGHVRYDALSRTATFRRGIDDLLAAIPGQRTCLLCAEEDPTGCHRRLLVGRVLVDHRVDVHHIRGDGSVLAEADMVQQLDLFDRWRSTAPIPGPRP